MITKNIVILYHKDCQDGFGGAWAAWKKFGNKAEYIGIKHEDPVPVGLQNKEIYMVDLTYNSLEVMKKLIAENKRVTAIDHHISAEAAIKLTEKYSYALDHSGCVLAWMYFHPQKKIPRLLKCIEDIDIWTLKIPESRKVFLYLQTQPMNFKTRSKIAQALENAKTRKKIINSGASMLAFEEYVVDNLLKKNAELVEFEGYKTYALNSSHFQSQAGSRLAIKLPPIAIIWNEHEGHIYVSLRSDGTVDVSKIAQKYNGGGHKAAAAFRFPYDQKKPWQLIIQPIKT